MKTLVFLIGFLMVSYGLFWAFASGSVLKGMLWIFAGICLEIAGGAISARGQRGEPENPLAVLTNGLRNTRETVQGWDGRIRSADVVEQQDAADGAGKTERRS